MGLMCLWLQNPMGAAGTGFGIAGVWCVPVRSCQPCKEQLYQLNKKMWLIDGAEDRSAHLIGLESEVGGEVVHICTLLVPHCLIWR